MTGAAKYRGMLLDTSPVCACRPRMTMYINRILTVGKGTRDERRLTEAEVGTLTAPLVLIGEPGLGKTELTKSLAQRLETLRITGGHFYRTHDLGKLLPVSGKPI